MPRLINGRDHFSKGRVGTPELETNEKRDSLPSTITPRASIGLFKISQSSPRVSARVAPSSSRRLFSRDRVSTSSKRSLGLVAASIAPSNAKRLAIAASSSSKASVPSASLFASAAINPLVVHDWEV